MSSQNSNVWTFPEPEAKLLTGEDNPMFFNETGHCEPFPKRWKPSFPEMATQQPTLSNELLVPHCQYNPLNEPSPLGLRLRKSPSLLELAQKRINGCNTDLGDLPIEETEEQNKRDLKAKTRARASSSNDRFKASQFPGLLLRIGRWEYVSKHEGDLIAKFYFSKHKIVWEVLDDGLKKKFEISWADIVNMKAHFAANGPGTLTIVLNNPPLYFKEINPQPRKHTQWKSSLDFTNGEASTQRQHVLQCAQGVLDRHYKKLIQCDKGINFLTQHQNTVSNVSYFPPQTSTSDQNMRGNNVVNLPGVYVWESTPLGLTHQNRPEVAQSSSSGMITDIHGQNNMNQPHTPGFQQNIPISDLVNHTGNGLSEQNVSQNLPFSENAPAPGYPNEMLENISDILLNDNHLIAASDERILMSRVNSLCNLLQDYQNGQQIVNDGSTPHQVTNNTSTLDSVFIPVNTTQAFDHITASAAGSSLMAPQDGNDSSTPESNREPVISRNDSFGELVHQLPRIASLPRFVFDLSENGDILR